LDIHRSLEATVKRRSLVSLAAAGLFALGAAGVGPALAGTAAGNGAQKSGLLAAPSGSKLSDCNSQADTGKSGPNGWAMLNKTGEPVAGVMSTFQGEVHLTNATNDMTYDIYVGKPSGSNNICTPVGSLTTNGQGIGNGHIPSGTTASFSGTDGTYWVVLAVRGSADEAYASSPVPEL
jgi:hypothetical protein